MAITQITTNVADGLGLLLSQYRSQPNITALFTALLQSVQQIEDGLFGLIEGTMLYGGGAIGLQLDNIGGLVGLDRSGLTDAQYRTLLLGKIAQNNNAGTLNALVSLTQTVFEASQTFAQTPDSAATLRTAPAYVAFSVGGATLPEAIYPLVEGIVAATTSAGVMLTTLASHDASGAFACAGPQAWVGGFGDVNDPNVGAPFATLIYQNPAA